MKRWLIKTDPDDYPYAVLLDERRTVWDGVKNALAQRHLAAMRRGDAVLVYETGGVKAIRGTARVAGAPRPDPADPAGKRVAVELAAGEPLARPVPLAEIKSVRALAEFPLVRIGRLSVMPVSDAEWKLLTALAAS